MRRIGGWVALAVGGLVLVLAGSYLLDMRRAHERIRGVSTIVPSPYGPIEYTQGGQGPPVLVIHGAGGGYDQGELLVELPGARIARITAPTLIVHARDDLLQLYHNGAFAAATIPGAILLSFESGGHVVLAVEGDAIRAAVREHILTNAAPPTRPS